jgi:hypothetical protein
MLPRLAAKVSTAGDEYSSKKPGKRPILDRISFMATALYFHSRRAGPLDIGAKSPEKQSLGSSPARSSARASAGICGWHGSHETASRGNRGISVGLA